VRLGVRLAGSSSVWYCAHGMRVKHKKSFLLDEPAFGALDPISPVQDVEELIHEYEKNEFTIPIVDSQIICSSGTRCV